MNKKIFLKQNWLRISVFTLGIGLLFWLPIEDVSENSVFIISTAICSLFAYLTLPKKNIKPNGNLTIPSIGHFFLMGLLAGLAVSPVAVFLMIFKNGLHSHGSPDFTNAQIYTALRRTPVWTLSGSLIGLGTGVWQSTTKSTEHN